MAKANRHRPSVAITTTAVHVTSLPFRLADQSTPEKPRSLSKFPQKCAAYLLRHLRHLDFPFFNQGRHLHNNQQSRSRSRVQARPGALAPL